MHAQPKLQSLTAALLLAAAFLTAPAFAASAASGSPTAGTKAAAAKKAAPKPAAKAAVAKPEVKAKAKAAGKVAKADTRPAAGKKAVKKAAAKAEADDPTPGPLADFGKVDAPADVVHVANWVSHTRNHKKKAFVLIDKKQARLYVFDPKGKLKSAAPVLLGKAVGDHTAPGVGNKPLSQIKEEEKTTPAGRFLAHPGRNTSGEDIIWIDYNAAVSMHRLRKVSAAERRAERMATPDASDNRISNGCVNVPPSFYNSVLKPTVLKQGAYVYVLPETKTPQQLFGSFDVKDKPVQVAEKASK